MEEWGLKKKSKNFWEHALHNAEWWIIRSIEAEQVLSCRHKEVFASLGFDLAQIRSYKIAHLSSTLVFESYVWHINMNTK